jgi:catechol 2,3-dioxygenase-like lactoylglutathione lyase family enzyme
MDEYGGAWQGGAIRQNGFVVRDLDAALRYWTRTLGVGPFFRIAEQPLVGFAYRGEPSAMRMSVALAQSGGIQIELIEQLDDAPSAFRDFARTTGEGLQHVAYWTDRFDEVTAAAERRGMVKVQGGRSGSGGPDERFAYYEAPGGPAPMVEISETLGRKAELFEAVARASVAWDGREPVRDMAELLS